MNICQAKQQIKNAITAYFTKDELGNYEIPIEKQRPLFLVGPPGIGKTAIMKQIASELGIGLVSYSMTHHTRQSAIGLPFIVHKEYDGKEYSITEYTMSEIVASVHELMENSGVKQGILFLDEINCVSETLSPLMLQFLQYKVFGRHHIPEGWIVVTAGNPPEYNDSVREYDIATLDRLKKIVVEPDFEAWKEYAYEAEIHPAIMSFLEIKRSYFYSVETTVDGKNLVTPRGWEDLSKIIQLFEVNGLKVDEDLIIQYLQSRKIAKEFSIYYDLFKKYKKDYEIPSILDGKASDALIKRAHNAKFDERLAVVGLMLDAVNEGIREVINGKEYLLLCLELIKKYRQLVTGKKTTPKAVMEKIISEEEKALLMAKNSGALTQANRNGRQRGILFFRELLAKISGEENADAAFKIIKKEYDDILKGFKKKAEQSKNQLSNVFTFSEKAFGEGQEILIIVTELTANPNSAKFISEFGCEKYFMHNKDLLFNERHKEILKKLDDMKL